MREIKKTSCGSFYIGELPEGCKLCMEGKKLVLFVTGVCKHSCEYCTVSESRFGKDEVWANEKKVLKPTDIIDEANISSAAGAGITGGEPLLVQQRVIEYIKLLKKTFGNKFHIHLYTSGLLDTELKDVATALQSAGLDELRVHHNMELIKVAKSLSGWKVGMEIPVFPNEEEKICKLIADLETAGADFINLNELEFSDRNLKWLEERGYKLRDDSLTAVEGSAETAQKVLKWAAEHTNKISIHFCTAELKLNCQLRNRLRNRAKNIKKIFERISDDGFIIKGVIFGDLNEIERFLEENKISKKNYFTNAQKGRVETSEHIAKLLAKKTNKFKIAVVEEYPCAEPWDFELTPLNY